MAKKKYYVVWEGMQPGVFDNWQECSNSIAGYSSAKYKSFDSKEAAERAYNDSPFKYIGHSKVTKKEASSPTPQQTDPNSIAVDAACSGNPGKMEYRGVYTATSTELFHFGPVLGTNNVGEFLAIVHGLAYLKKNNLKMHLYSDSKIAISWIKQKRCKTLLSRTSKTEELFQMIERAEKWLHENRIPQSNILKWETKAWGEIPADFGRKK
jgi:ribonuclease HI